MQRPVYFSICEEKLSLLCTRIKNRGKLNILDYHNHSEDFYLHFLNELYGYELENINQFQQNVEGIDLCDKKNLIVLQVSSTATKQKIESALSKNLNSYNGYSFKFVPISDDADSLRTKKYKNPHQLTFSPASDVYDIPAILKKIKSLDIIKQRAISEFLKRELDAIPVNRFTETNLAEVINSLSLEDLSDGFSLNKPIPFRYDDKIEFNGLDVAAVLIDDYKDHYHRISRIYEEFDAAGKNKSNFVFQSLRTAYLKLNKKHSGDELFFKIVEEMVTVAQNSSNCVTMPLDELEQHVSLIAVDAFIRCKIFKNPSKDQYAAAREHTPPSQSVL